MATSVNDSEVAAIFGCGSDRRYHYRIEEKENGKYQTIAKKTHLGDFFLIEKFEMDCILSTRIDLENTFIMTIFLSPGYVLWQTGVTRVT